MTLDQVRNFALSLPDVSEAPHFHYTSFRVRRKIFATAQPGGDFLHVFVPEAAREAALARAPDFLETLSWGARVVGLRVLLAVAKADVVEPLVRQAWAARAPKRLLGSVAR